MEKIIVSHTGYQSGFGRDAHKCVCGLSKKERDLVKGGAVVLIHSTPHLNGRKGCCWRRVFWNDKVRRFIPRVPTGVALELAMSLDINMTLHLGKSQENIKGTIDLI